MYMVFIIFYVDHEVLFARDKLFEERTSSTLFKVKID